MNNSDTSITLRVPSELKEELKRIASINYKKYQALIKEILIVYVKNYDKIEKEENELRNKYRKIWID